MTVNKFPPLAADDESHERDLSIWAAGWDACALWLWPQLARANNDADRLYRKAFPIPAHVWHGRLGVALNEALREEVRS